MSVYMRASVRPDCMVKIYSSSIHAYAYNIYMYKYRLWPFVVWLFFLLSFSLSLQPFFTVLFGSFLSLPKKSQIKTSLLVVSSSSQGCMSVLCEHTRSYVLVYITSLVNFGIFFIGFLLFPSFFISQKKNINKNNFYYSCCFFYTWNRNEQMCVSIVGDSSQSTDALSIWKFGS